MITDVSSLPTDNVHYVNEEISGSGNGHDNKTLPGSKRIECQCNDTNLMVNKSFLVKWLRKDSQYSISKLTVAANQLKDDTQYLQVHT